MKLIKCYIENYGTLSKYELDFSDKLTVINEDNGFGKSTLASFIKAMFYGLPQTTKRKVEENERKLRAPWQGGNFGGTLEVEIGGKRYRIERFFGSKANADTFRLFDLESGSESSDYSENIGVEIFGIDAEGFERSVFLPQLKIETGANTSITAKLTDLVENSDDLNNYDKAMDSLKKRKNEYSTGRGKGFVPTLREDIAAAESRLEDCKAAAGNVAELGSRCKEHERTATLLEKELLQVREDLRIASDMAALSEQKKRKFELESEISALKVKADEITKLYPNGLPEEDVLSKALQNADDFKALSNEYRVLAGNGENEQELVALRETFSGVELQAADIESARQKAFELNELKIKLNAKQEFLKTVNNKTDGAKSSLQKPLGIVAVVLAVVGCALFIYNVTAALAVLLLGVCVGVVSGFLYLKGMISQNAPGADVSAVKVECERLNGQVLSLTSELEAFFARFNLDGDYSEQAYRLKSKWDEYQKLQNVAENREQRLSQVQGKLTEAKLWLDEFWKRFAVREVDDYYTELLKMRDYKKALFSVQAELSDKQARLSALPELEQNAVRTDLDREELLKQEKALSAEVDRVNKLILELKNRITSLAVLADAVPDLENEIASLKVSLAEKESELFTIEKTMEFLEIARGNLSNKYRGTMSEGFKKYADMMLGDDIGRFLLDSDLNINIERYGKAQEKESFSTGYQNLIDIATRFALVDALYKGEKPPVVLDDPFVNLDKGKIENALALLQKLAEDRQIIYLTCHDSRCPK